MKKEEYWAAFVKTGGVEQYLAYKKALNSPAGREEKKDASIHRRDHRAGEYRF